jgi:RND family efflux transporter MFP subunit
MDRLLRGALAAVLLLCACGKDRGKESARSQAPVPVRVRVVEPVSGDSQTRYSGTVEPATQVDVAFKVGGYVEQIAQNRQSGSPRLIQEGDPVRKGMVLAVVRTADYQNKVDSARAQLVQATAELKQAEIEYGRSSRLFASASVSQADLDRATVTRDTAKAKLDGAQVQLRDAQLQLSDCTLRSPLDGVLIRRGIEIGTLAAPGATGFVVADTSAVKVVFGAPDALVAKLRLGSPIIVTTEAVPGELQGTITRISPSADPRGRLYDVESKLPNPNGLLKSGMTASFKVPGASLAQEAVAVPLTSVVRSPREPRGFAVYVVLGDAETSVARVRDVKLGDTLGNAIVAREGLKLGERVVTLGATLLNDGSHVRVIP